jgi:hypothetical protein
MSRTLFKPKPSQKGLHFFYIVIIGALFLCFEQKLFVSQADAPSNDLGPEIQIKLTELENIRDQYNKLRQTLKMPPLQNLRLSDHVEIEQMQDAAYIHTQTPTKGTLLFSGNRFIGRIIPNSNKQQILTAFDQSSALLVKIGDHTTLLFGQGNHSALSDKIPTDDRVHVGQTVVLAKSLMTPSGFEVGRVASIQEVPNQKFIQLVIEPFDNKSLPQFAETYSYL